jgi:thiamine-phosphate diphosphorylase
MIDRQHFDISAYLVVGPENTRGRSVEAIVAAAVQGGFTCVQIRSKEASARELVRITVSASQVIERLGRSQQVALLVNDRLDVVLAARHAGAKVDGIHVGQSDIPVAVCRKYLGNTSVIGLSARTHELMDYVAQADVADIDYFGAGPLRETATKPDCGLDIDGTIRSRSFGEIAALAAASPIPVVLGGGVALADLPDLAETGVAGFFVVTAVTHADDPQAAAQELVHAWHAHRPTAAPL